MRYIRLETSDQDTRWINLEQVCRVTRGIESPGVPIVAIIFADGNVDDCLKIRGTDEINKKAISQLVGALDRLSCEEEATKGSR
jgi:hypothetical protein